MFFLVTVSIFCRNECKPGLVSGPALNTVCFKWLSAGVFWFWLWKGNVSVSVGCPSLNYCIIHSVQTRYASAITDLKAQIERFTGRAYSFSSSVECALYWLLCEDACISVDLQVYLQRFQWDMAKFPTKQSLKAIADQISKQMSQIETDLKTKATAYNSIKGNLLNLERKAT